MPELVLTITEFESRSGRNYYREWLDSLTDKEQAIVLEHINRLRHGIGTKKPLGDKLWELKIRFGPGYRVFYCMDGAKLVVLLAGSIKKAQERTIVLAKRLMKEYEEEKRNAA